MATAKGSMETVARSFIDAFNRRDAEALVAAADPEIEFHPTPLVGAHNGYHGRDGLRRWLEEIVASGVEHRVRVREVRKLDESQVVVLSEVLIDGEPVSSLSLVISFSKAGEIAKGHAFLSDEATLVSVGLLTGPLGS